MPREWYRWHMAERFGWTLEYVDALMMQDFHEFLQVEDGKRKAGASTYGKFKK